MTYPECLSYLYQHLPMFHRVGNIAFNKGLQNIEALCYTLNNPQQYFKSVHVAGTNGKGSSSNMLAAVLQQAGYKTGLYTSPHLKDFTERIKINGTDIPKEYVVNFVVKNQDLFAQIKPSFFEMTVALAFKFFAEEQVDIAIIEVGLGGRLDSTNIITPLISLITNIGLDHQSLLGDNLPSIASEKAGIIKPNIPVVISKTQPEVREVFINKAAAEGAPILFADQRFQVNFNGRTFQNQRFQVREKGCILWEDLELDLMGNYQRENLPGVLATLDYLQEQGYHIGEKNLRNGLAQVRSLTGFKGRWQILQEKPLIICDTGHNVDGIKQVVSQLATTTSQLVHFVFGAVKDKDVSEILQLLPQHYRYYFCQAQIPRALPVDELMKLAAEIGLEGESYATVSEAVKAAKTNVRENEVIFIGGSTFVVAEIEDL
ncbi:dihydrofolate synthase [Adhaeribacter arboris]|uniref:Dihydrofolate synthase/folylpolyglutamate synthase n=1 Tax=Adhaeribacter arboris TaxID=2072846 RepID=A0A2T2YBV7_9BACT|nr:folylpolyglutamate synthase/dihydrofolate synthase family protein [Adhaeribacter arboris]PSR52997.1 dihydrofolate synthase [Adhaeribacter arboris]